MGNKYYLKTFNNKTEYESQKNSVMYTPHVVLLNDTEEVVYESNARKKASNDYFTITALDNGYLTLAPPQFGVPEVASIEPQQEVDSFKYRKNKGDWEEFEGEVVIYVKPGDTIQMSCESDSFNHQLLSSSNVRFDVSGNIMSLIYGDDFIGQTTLKSEGCFSSLLSSSNVVSAKNLILPATELTEWCYAGMFAGCTSLTTSPEELPATTLAEGCYSEMFSYCTSLTTAQALPATTLASDCYSYMFEGCTGLTVAQSLPATTLAERCYQNMFYGCTSLTTAPELPATTLAEGCYNGMFSGCTGLTTAPALPATTLANSCYSNMFKGCNKLNYITMLATNISDIDCLYNWVKGVAESGTFVKNPLTSLPSGKSGVPYGWSVVDYNPFAKEYFTIESLEDGLTVSFSNGINDVSYGLIGIEYSINNGVWNSLSSEVETPTVNTGDKISFRGNAIHDPEVMCNFIGQFTISKKCSLHGNIMSLLYDTDFEYKTDLNGFNCAFGIPPVAGLEKLYGLFCNCTNIIDASDLILPATTLSLASYSCMFANCTSLTTAPELPATTLTWSCYNQMFYGCKSLSKIIMLATNISAGNCLSSWTHGVASSGTFVKSPYMTSLPSGPDGIPEGWTVENINGAPDVELGPI